MPDISPTSPGQIFISYRRDETAYAAGWLYDRLADRFGPDKIFKDIDSIELGDDFAEVITTAVGSCDVLLALIGDEWLTITGEDGQRRLDDPADFVRVEIEAALTRDVRVIPVLVDGASMPHAESLPAGLTKLVRRQALELSPSRFDFDTGRLLSALDEILAGVQAKAAATARPPQVSTAPDEGAPPHRPAPAGESRRVVWRVVAGLVILVMGVAAALFIKADGEPSERSISTDDSQVATGSTVTTAPRTTSTAQSLDPNAVESYYTADGTRPALAPTCLGLLSLCLRQPVDSAVAALGTEDERTDFGGGDVFHSWNLTPEVRFSVISDSVGSIKSLTMTRSTIGESEFRTFAPEGGLFGELTMAEVKGQYGVTPTEETLPGEGFILYTYSYVRGGEGSAVLEFTHGAPFDNDPGGFNSDLDGRLVTSVSVREA